ncbi:MAG: DNA polymerase III subunit gamma/tau [Clostridia bacterium]|nr:DNA polymerase III subunit gamma/tau [Clostridia bacterium]
MEYTALYRKFRPLKFEDIVGQEHITTTLKNQIKSNRVGHAYLFNGGRGTGKTSAAKVLARAVNCLNPQGGEPCNECEICKMALSGNLTDIVEMDAASNNSVDDIRLIREEVNFLPTVAKYRVYIIDEAHMLTTGAFNALLKTLEEPPKHVKFILATTEPQKILTTILSRCQKFNFKKISNENISKRLKYICDIQGISITTDALKLIAVLSEGAMRDALSILERCIQDGAKDIKQEKVKELVGIPSLTYVHKIADSIINYNYENSMDAIREVMDEGKDIEYFIWEVIKYIRDILIYKTSKNLDIYSDEELGKIKDLSEKVSNERLLRIIYDLSQLENDIKKSSQKIIIFQAGIIRLSTNLITDKAGIDELKDKILELEKKVSSIEKSGIQSDNTGVRQSTSTEKIQKNVPQEKITKQDKVTGKKAEGTWWKDIITEFKNNQKIMLYTNLLNTEIVELNDTMVGIRFLKGLNKFGKAILEKNENQTEIRKRISMHYGKDMQIKFLTEEEKEVKHESDFESLVKSLDIPMDIIDE